RQPQRVRINFDIPVSPGCESMLLANRDPRHPARLRVTLRPEITGIAEVSRRTGREGRIDTPDSIAENAYTIRLAPGDGRLFALVEQRRENWPTPERGIGVSVGGVSVGIGR